jgi:type II secretory pathway component PulJ
MNRTRRGHTLVEILAVIAVYGVTFSLLTVALHSIFRTTARFRDEESRSSMLVRLDLQFRADAHAATRWELASTKSTGEPAPLTLFGVDDVRIEYRMEKGQVHRLLSRPGAPVQRETYWLGNNVSTRFDVVTNSNEVPSAGLLIEQRPNAETSYHSPTRTQAIRAVLGSSQPVPAVRQ